MISVRRKADILDWAIIPAVVLYIVTAYTVSAIPVVARTNPAIGAVLVVLILLRIAVSGLRPNWKYWVLPVLFALYAIASAAWSKDPDRAMFIALRSSAALLGGVAVWVALEYGMSWKIVIWATFIGAVVMILPTIGLAVAGGYAARLAGLAGNPNTMAMYLTYAAFMIWCSPVKLPKWLHVLGAGLLGFAFFFSGSRKILVVLVGIALLLLVKAPRHLRRLSVRVGLALLLLGIPATWIVLAARGVDVVTVVRGTQTVERIGNLVGVERRLAMMRSAMALWQERPLTGHGAGQFAIVGEFETYSHSNYTELLTCLGLTGFVLYYALPLALLARALHGWARRSSPHQSAFAMLVLILVLDVFMVSFGGRGSGVFLAYAAAMAMLPGRRLVRTAFPVRWVRMTRAWGAGA